MMKLVKLVVLLMKPTDNNAGREKRKTKVQANQEEVANRTDEAAKWYLKSK